MEEKERGRDLRERGRDELIIAGYVLMPTYLNCMKF